jgi:hypothetical protein
MKYIAHRGLTTGPNKQFENQPNIIRTALEQGYDAEIDLWVVDGRLYLGHDEPQYNVTTEFITTAGLWIHAKSLAAFDWLVNSQLELNYFWHENDSYTLTSQGYIWAYPGRAVTARSVMVMPEYVDATLVTATTADCYAICSDWVEKIRLTRNN